MSGADIALCVAGGVVALAFLAVVAIDILDCLSRGESVWPHLGDSDNQWKGL